MEIPALYSVFRGGEVRAAPVSIEGTDISFVSDPVPPSYSSEGSEERMTVLVADVKGLGRKDLDDRLLTKMKFPGSDIWFMTCIEDTADVFDCFMGNAMKILIPYHTVKNDDILKDTFDVTENCIPTLFVSHGKVVCRDGSAKDIGEAVGELERTGFTEIVVFDTDSTLRNDDWSAIYERSPGVIPFVRNKYNTEGTSFQKIIIDY